MQGTLFKYGPGSGHVAFKHAQPLGPNPTQVGQYLVLVGGLTDGLLFAPYCQQLADSLAHWTLVQAQLTSSYQGWGLSSLDQDASELKMLSDCLAANHGCVSWVIMGHSTGCQDAVRYVQRCRADDPCLIGVILQAPVSDREYFGMYPSWTEHIQRAQEMVTQGRGEEIVWRAVEWDGAAVTARRLVSLACVVGDDDMFSTDLTLDQLRAILGPLQGLPTLIIQSGADESVPESIRNNGSMEALGQRMIEAIQLGPKCGVHQPSTVLAAAAVNSGPRIIGAHNTDSGTAAAAAADGGGETNENEAQKKSPSKLFDSSNSVQLRVIEDAGHACKGHEKEVVDLVCEFLGDLHGSFEMKL